MNIFNIKNIWNILPHDIISFYFVPYIWNVDNFIWKNDIKNKKNNNIKIDYINKKSLIYTCFEWGKFFLNENSCKEINYKGKSISKFSNNEEKIDVLNLQYLGTSCDIRRYINLIKLKINSINEQGFFLKMELPNNLNPLSLYLNNIMITNCNDILPQTYTNLYEINLTINHRNKYIPIKLPPTNNLKKLTLKPIEKNKKIILIVKYNFPNLTNINLENCVIPSYENAYINIFPIEKMPNIKKLTLLNCDVKIPNEMNNLIYFSCNENVERYFDTREKIKMCKLKYLHIAMIYQLEYFELPNIEQININFITIPDILLNSYKLTKDITLFNIDKLSDFKYLDNDVQLYTLNEYNNDLRCVECRTKVGEYNDDNIKLFAECSCDLSCFNINKWINGVHNNYILKFFENKNMENIYEFINTNKHIYININNTSTTKYKLHNHYCKKYNLITFSHNKHGIICPLCKN